MKAIDPTIRAAAIADYHNGDDPIATVAARHGVSKSRLSAWIKPGYGRQVDAIPDCTLTDEDLAYEGGWEVRGGGVRYPLEPQRRSA